MRRQNSFSDLANDHVNSKKDVSPLNNIESGPHTRESIIHQAMKASFLTRMAGRPAKAALSFAKEHPVATGFGFSASAFNAILAFCAPTSFDASNLLTAHLIDLVLDKPAWFAFSILNSLAAMGVNTFINSVTFVLLPIKFARSWERLKHPLAAPGEFIEALAGLLVVGAPSFFASLGLSYSAFAFMTFLLAMTFAEAQSNVMFATRFTGFHTLVENIKKFFSIGEREQQFSIEILNNLNSETINEINNFLIGKELDENTIAKVFEQISKKHEAAKHDKVFEQISKKHEAAKHDSAHENENTSDTFEYGCLEKSTTDILATLFDVSLGTVGAMSVYTTFAQKGSNGLEKFEELLGQLGKYWDKYPAKWIGRWEINAVPTWYKDLNPDIKSGIAILPGTSSAIFYFKNLFYLRRTLLARYEAWQNGETHAIDEIIKVLILILSGSSMFYAADKVTQQQHGADLLSIISSPFPANKWATGAAAACTNSNIVLEESIKADELPSVSPTVADIIKKLKITHNHEFMGADKPHPEKHSDPSSGYASLLTYPQDNSLISKLKDTWLFKTATDFTRQFAPKHVFKDRENNPNQMTFGLKK